MSHDLMMGGWVVLREVVGQVDGATAPVDDELALLYAITDPVESHVHGLGAALLDGAVDDARGAYVVGHNFGGVLRVPQFDEADADGHGVLAAPEEGAGFCFCSGCQDALHDAAEDVNGAIHRRQGGVS